MSALLKIRNAGFQIEIDNGDLLIEPGDKLTDKQLDFLKSHKAEIISDLRAERAANEIISSLMVRCYSPSGLCYEVEARDEEHAAWLKRMNPKPKGNKSC